MKKDDPPPGIIPITPEMLEPEGPLATAVRRNVSKSEDAPAVREGSGWAGELEGFCPVQGYGTVDGQSWHFRARGESWLFEVWAVGVSFGKDGRLPDPDPVWTVDADYGTSEFEASWMPYSHAWRFIEESIARFRAVLNAKGVPLEKRSDGKSPPESIANDVLRACWCLRCIDAPKHGLDNPAARRMILCPACGNKRCPRATDHRFACTGSNETGQFGSDYGVPCLETAVPGLGVGSRVRIGEQALAEHRGRAGTITELREVCVQLDDDESPRHFYAHQIEPGT